MGYVLTAGTEPEFMLLTGNTIAVPVWQVLSQRLARVLERTITLPHICEETLKFEGSRKVFTSL